MKDNHQMYAELYDVNLLKTRKTNDDISDIWLEWGSFCCVIPGNDHAVIYQIVVL